MKFIIAISLSSALTFAGHAMANDAAQVAAVDVPTEITLQHGFVEQFRFFDDPHEFPRFFPLVALVRNDAVNLAEPGMMATIEARDQAEVSLVASTYRRYGATVHFATVINPDAELVKIKVYR